MRSRPYSNAAVEVVADLGDVTGDDFGEVWKLRRERGGLLQLRVLGELTDLLLRDGRTLLGAVERDALLLEGEAVDVGVQDRVGLDGQLDREAALAEAAEDGVVERGSWRVPVTGATPSGRPPSGDG